MEDFSEVFNGLTDAQKHDNFVEVYNLMVKNHRFCGWVRYFGDHFLFFDSKPSYEDAIWVSTDELLEWIEALKVSTDNQPPTKGL